MKATVDAVDSLLWEHRTVASNGTQTVCACDRAWRSDTEHRTHLRNAVLALVNGPQVTPGAAHVGCKANGRMVQP